MDAYRLLRQARGGPRPLLAPGRTPFRRNSHPAQNYSVHRGKPGGAAGFALLVFVTILPCARLHAQDTEQPVPDAPATDQSEDVPWLDSLAQGYVEAQRDRQPIIVVAGATWCEFCAALNRELESEAVQEELTRWVAVAIDVDESPADARTLGIGPVPALRILGASGHLVASHDGAQSADELVDWLQSHFEAASISVSEELTSAGRPDARTVIRLVKAFEQRDATLREAAIRRLKPYPDAAATHVVSKFRDGSLAVRLASLDLLAAWHAPVEDLDPWVPESITAERLEQLSTWLKEADLAPLVEQEQPLTATDIADARQAIRLLLQGDAGEAAAIREQLADFGKSLLPIVYEELSLQTTDEARERLTALRYRLAAAPELVLQWPGGLERLADTDLDVRTAAADELALRATSADETLLLELFSDPAPLIREISLRALQNVGGSSADSALIGLLDDPNPNVRAAVLKQLAESPSQSIVPRISEYVAEEVDSDLIVHAVRLLREASGAQSADTLVTLLEHESWRVRAESAEALGQAVGSYGNLNDAKKSQIYVSLIHLLEDEDAFVVSRAVESLSEADLVTAVEPLVAVAERHPDLADDVVASLAAGSNQRAKALPYIRDFCTHQLPQVRAAAILGLCRIAQSGARDELIAALADEESSVRTAAANAFFEQVESSVNSRISGVSNAGFRALPDEEPGVDGENDTDANDNPDIPEETETDSTSGTSGDSAGDETANAPADAVIRALRENRELSEWIYAFEEHLRPLLQAEFEGERLAAARPLAVLGDVTAFDVLTASAQVTAQTSTISEVLPYLPWSEREVLFRAMTEPPSSREAWSTVAYQFVRTPDYRAVDLIWELLGRSEADAKSVEALMASLRRGYFGQNYYDPSDAPRTVHQHARLQTTQWALEGSRWQKTAALVLRLSIDREGVVDLARQVYEDEQSETALRADAFQVLLRSEPDEEATGTALDGINSGSDAVRQLGLRYLVQGGDALNSLAGRISIDSYGTTSFPSYSYAGSGSPIVPEAPEGLTPEMIAPLLESADPAIVAQAGYLSALLDQPDGLRLLLNYWNASARNDSEYTRLVYRAIACLNDTDRVPLLESLYDQTQEGRRQMDLDDFYWTIRIMSGPDVLALRKRIRDEVGIDNLR